ncbi:HAMP domain-containing sensor histidine kinase [Sulfuriflexus sp.]|uniref:sensor histidine kinase n=1 Tax=Sulfuriflexus sp. TaxID=2015443 RepID=UPI0028CC0CF7|nr:HAMP domain-containing sensor histidine kinase [Sulfuriflexus sp.]MDT8403242.1 HAMP domain-containing sensor histidine kinase [Sulfuriflexus sp.]
MRFRTSLYYRITLAFSLLGMVVSLGLAAVLYVLTIDLEEHLIAETLSTELEDYIMRYEIDSSTLPPASTTIKTHVILPETTNIPPELRELQPGLQQVQLADKDYYAEVRVSDERRFIILYDARQIQKRESQFKFFLGIGVLIMTLLSALLGLWLAGRVIAPVGALATRVAGLRPEDHHAPLAGDFPSDEVGTLACEFDAYLERLAAFIEREQAFTADVSHELRTPLAVIEGATETLLDDPELDEARRVRLERIARAAREMAELVTALLLLAREGNDEVSGPGCSVAEVLQQVVESHQYLLRHKDVVLELDIQAQTILPVECVLLRVVLANLVRNAIAFTDQGRVQICLEAKGVSIKDTGIGISREHIQRVFDRYYTGATGNEGIGLSLVKRICQRFGWRIDIDSREGYGTQILLSFPTLR